LKEISNDTRFENVLKYSDDMKLNVLMERKLDVLREYCQKWGVKESEQSVNDRLKELYEACVMAFGATGQRPDSKNVRLDFFLMHGLTSVLFVKVLLKFVSLPNQVKLLRGHFATVLSYYISRGCPKFYPDLLINYEPEFKPKDESNPWFDVIEKAFNCEDAHVIKVVRSLMKADEEWGGGDQNTFLKVAQLTVDHIHYPKDWSFDGIGFDEEWE